MAVGIVGLGYVGLPLLVAFAEAGEEVIAIDVDTAKIEAIEAGESYIEDIASERLAAVRDQVIADNHFAPLARAEAVLICVPTPLTPNREPDLGPLNAAAESVARVSSRAADRSGVDHVPGHHPGVLVPILERESGLSVGRG